MRRRRCVICKELTHSGWHLGYAKNGKWFEGAHCFKCKKDVMEKQEREDVKITIG